jgi:electron-transferring-flavoprotein dehydrogenase
MKHHPYLSTLLTGGERLAYGARTLNEGGLNSVPKLDFPGGALIGCAAGFVNIAKIKGTHNAMKSGMLAAEGAFEAIVKSDAEAESAAESEAESESESESTVKPLDMSHYDTALRKSWVWEDLNEVRNLRASFATPLGLWGGIAYSGVDSLFLKGRTPWTLRLKGSDAGHTKRARWALIISPL